MKKNKKNTHKNKNKTLLIFLLVLLLLEIVLIPCLVYAGVKQVLAITAFLIMPTLFGIVIILLGRICVVDYDKKKLKLEKGNDRKPNI